MVATAQKRNWPRLPKYDFHECITRATFLRLSESACATTISLSVTLRQCGRVDNNNQNHAVDKYQDNDSLCIASWVVHFDSTGDNIGGIRNDFDT